MWKTVLRSLRAGVVTTRYPDQRTEPPEAFRGAPAIRPGASFADLAPPEVCPSGAIGAPEGGRYAIDLARCVFCGRCASGAPDGPIHMSRDFELSARRREDLLVAARRDQQGVTVTDQHPARRSGASSAAHSTSDTSTPARATRATGSSPRCSARSTTAGASASTSSPPRATPTASS